MTLFAQKMVHYVAGACTEKAWDRLDAMRAIEDAILSDRFHRLSRHKDGVCMVREKMASRASGSGRFMTLS